MKSAIVLLCMLFVAIGESDVVYLKSGGKLEGKVTEKGSSVEIAMPTGIVTIPRNQIERIERSISKVELYQQYRNVLKAEDVEGHYHLALWCLENKLEEYYYRELQAVIAHDPDHEKAREALGYERYEGRWVTHDEAMTLRGYVKFRGEWTTPAQRDAILLEELEKQLVEERRLREATEERLAQAERRIYALELELTRLDGYVRELAEEVRRRRYIIIKKQHYPIRTDDNVELELETER